MSVDAPARIPAGTMDVDEFMAFLEPRPHTERWELIEGVAIMMASPTLAHQRIADNLHSLLNRCFEEQGLDLHAYHEVAVRTAGVRDFQPRPDVSVVPGVAGYDLYSERFQLAAEVLSPSNTRRRIDQKLHHYQEAPDNRYAIVIGSRSYLVEVRAKARDWQPVILQQPDDPVELPDFGFRCALGDLYRGTPLDPRRR